MSIHHIDRRQFLTLPLAFLLAPLARAAAAGGEARRGTYTADVGILYDILTFHLDGTLEESIDRAVGRYTVRVAGHGESIANRIESNGMLRNGRWVPLRTASWFQVHGRESRTEITYDWERWTIAYHARAETFLLRRLRVVDDQLSVPDGALVDDAFSATLNYAGGHWSPQADGSLRTQVVRRRRRDGEGADDTAGTYRAELVPFELKVAPDPVTGKATALIDMTRFSSWAQRSRPARIVFGADRRPELITTSLILGTSVTIRLTSA